MDNSIRVVPGEAVFLLRQTEILIGAGFIRRSGEAEVLYLKWQDLIQPDAA